MNNDAKEDAISRNVVLLGLVSFLNDLSSEMIIPILPMFITALGGNGFIVGLIGGLRDSISSIIKVFSGYLSDKSGRKKPFVVAGYTISSLFKFLLGLSSVWQHILVFATLERIGKGLRTAPRDAIISESMPKERGRGFGIHRTMDTLGAIMGGVIVFILFWYFNLNFSIIILIASGIAFSSLIPLYFVRDIKRKIKEITFRISIKQLTPELRKFIFTASVFTLANFSYMFFLLKSQEIFTGKPSVGIPILLYVIFNITYASLSMPAGIISDKIGKKKVIVLGYMLFTLTSIGFALISTLPAYILLFISYGAVYALVDGTQRAYVADLAPENLKATGLGAYHTLTGLSSLVGSLSAGILWQLNTTYPFIYGAILGTVSTVLLYSMVRG